MPEPTKDPKMTVENIEVRFRPIQPDEPGFLPFWRRILQTKRGIMDLDHAQPEDVDGAMELLMEYMTFPESRADKLKVLNRVTSTEFMSMFNILMGKGDVPPVNGGA